LALIQRARQRKISIGEHTMTKQIYMPILLACLLQFHQWQMRWRRKVPGIV
jgi:hypothetical protein